MITRRPLVRRELRFLPTTPSGEDHEFIRRGLPYEDAGARQIRQLSWLGVTDVVQIPRTDVGTEGVGQVLPPWCDQHQFRSIVFVAARDHSRRLRRVLDRVMKGHPTRVTVRPARYSSFDPDRWWETRGGVRIEIIELQKLVHPRFQGHVASTGVIFALIMESRGLFIVVLRVAG